MKNDPLPRLDASPGTRNALFPYCRLRPGEIWIDPINGHRVGCLDASDSRSIKDIMDGERAQLAIHDPPIILSHFSRGQSWNLSIGVENGYCTRMPF